MTVTYDQIRDFLYKEVRLLDDRDFDAWLELYSPDVVVWMPSWDDDGTLVSDPQREVSLMYYPRRDGLEDRVFRINTEKSTASAPPPRTSHNISNIEILRQDDSTADVRFNWVTYSYRYQKTDQYFGTSYYKLEKSSDGVRIKDKTVILKNDCIRQVLDIYHV
jgi:benzoate/toluate 1,2-dioxygenase beta subunit